MPGPCSVPNGDPRLVKNPMVCASHGEKRADCGDKCVEITLREYLLRQNRLFTGKTKRK